MREHCQVADWKALNITWWNLIRAHSAFTKVFIKELQERRDKISPGAGARGIFIICLSVCSYLSAVVYLSVSEIPPGSDTQPHRDARPCRIFVLQDVPDAAQRLQVVRTIHNTQLWTGLKMGWKVEKFFIRNNSSIAISSRARQLRQNITKYTYYI